MNLAHLGKRIRDQREKHGLKQIDIANALQISSQAVSKWERGENAPDIAILLDLAKLLGVTSDWLLGGTTGEKDTFEATVLCTSINLFAKEAEDANPKEIALWANSIFFGLTESALNFEGVPVKYVGDGFLCFFTGADHADRAVKAAIQAKKMPQNINVMISINSGDIFLGSIGHPDYANHDIIGETVNNAFIHLNWIAKNCKSGIGLSEATKKQIKLEAKLSQHLISDINTNSEQSYVYELLK